MQFGQNVLNQLQLFVRHGFDYKASIMAEKEEAAAGSSSLTSLEDLITVLARVQRTLYLIEIDIVHRAHSLENAR